MRRSIRAHWACGAENALALGRDRAFRDACARLRGCATIRRIWSSNPLLERRRLRALGRAGRGAGLRTASGRAAPGRDTVTRRRCAQTRRCWSERTHPPRWTPGALGALALISGPTPVIMALRVSGGAISTSRARIKAANVVVPFAAALGTQIGDAALADRA